MRWRMLLIFFLMAAGLILVWCLPDNTVSGSPVRTPQGTKWRIGYLQGGPWRDYPLHLSGFFRGLMDEGWMQRAPLPEPADPEDTRSLWQWAVEHAESDYLEFLPEAYWDAGWDDEKRIEIREQVLTRLAERHDIDLMIGMGTWGGQDLANDRHSTPVIVMSTSNPVQSGIIQSIDDSGFDHVFAMCNPLRYERQIRTFHSIVNFKSVGVVVAPTEDGPVWANVPDLLRVGKELGFSVVTETAVEAGVSEAEAAAAVKAAYARLADKVDAVWLGAHQGESPENMPGILEPLFEHRIPTWSQTGSRHVARGVLFSINERDLDGVGRFYAKTMAKIFHGALPRDLPQVFEDPSVIVINEEVARRIGFLIPPALKAAADIVYQNIEGDVPRNAAEEFP